MWLGSASLSITFPTLFRVLCNKDDKLSDVLSRKAEVQQWIFQFRRGLYVWELEKLEELRNLLDVSGVVASIDRPDQLTWQGCTSGKFSVNSVYNLAVSSPNHQNKTFS